MSPIQKKVHFHFALMQALFWLTIFGNGSITAYLVKQGLNATQTGLVFSLGALIEIILLPIFGRIADRIGSPKVPAAISMIICVLFSASLPIAVHLGVKDATPLMAIAVMPSIMFGITNAMNNSTTTQYIMPFGIPFTSVRMYGSITYAVFCLIMAGIVAAGAPMEIYFFVPLLFIVPHVYVTLTSNKFEKYEPVVDETEKAKKTEKKGKITDLFKNYYYVLLLVCMLGFNIQQSVTGKYLAFIIEAAGADTKYITVYAGIRAFMEMVSMLCFTKLISKKKIKLWQIIAADGLVCGVEHFIYLTATNFTGTLMAMIPAGIANGILLGVIPHYIYNISEDGVKATAQSFSTMVAAIISIVGMLLGGIVVDTYGIKSLVSIDMCIALGASAVFVIGILAGRKVTGKEPI